MMLKRFLGALRHSKQPPKLLNTSWDHLRKFFLIEFSTFGSHFLVMELTNPLKMVFYEGFQNLKACSRRELWLRYDRRRFFGSYCNFLSSRFCWKRFLAEKKNQFWTWAPPKIRSNLCFWSCFPLLLHGFERIFGGAKVQNWFFQQEIILNKIRSTESCNMIQRRFLYHI